MTERSRRTLEAVEAQLYVTKDTNDRLRYEVLRLREALRQANIGHLRRRRGRERLRREIEDLRLQVAFFMASADETAIRGWAAQQEAKLSQRRMAVGLPPKSPTPTRFERLLEEIAGFGAGAKPPAHPVEEVIEHPALTVTDGKTHRS